MQYMFGQRGGGFGHLMRTVRQRQARGVNSVACAYITNNAIRPCVTLNLKTTQCMWLIRPPVT